MRKLSCLLVLFLIANSTFCQPVFSGKPVVEPAKILKDDMGFLYYNRDYLRTSQELKAYNTKGQAISKAEFFSAFASGNYLPVRLMPNSDNRYKLYKLGSKVSEGVRSTIKQYGTTAYNHFKMEGKKFPGLNYKDVDGRVYNSQNTKGKIVVIKCWFLHCQACNEEIPQLNTFVDQYKNRGDIVFVSLAFDAENKLKVFKKTHEFKYALAHVPESYIEKQLGTTEYPTHYIVNKQGLIAKVVNEAGELEVALRTEASK
ncbi:MAG: TlpA disulfide reductase family protein [Bacteroidota bacterium]